MTFLCVFGKPWFSPPDKNHRPLRADGLSSQAAVLILFSSRSESASGFFISSGRAAARLGAPGQAAVALAFRDESHRAIQRTVLAMVRVAAHAVGDEDKQLVEPRLLFITRFLRGQPGEGQIG